MHTVLSGSIQFTFTLDHTQWTECRWRVSWGRRPKSPAFWTSEEEIDDDSDLPSKDVTEGNKEYDISDFPCATPSLRSENAEKTDVNLQSPDQAVELQEINDPLAHNDEGNDVEDDASYIPVPLDDEITTTNPNIWRRRVDLYCY